MIKSMTGYGSFKNNNDLAQIYVEIKSLNSRFFDFYSKSCKTLSVYDDDGNFVEYSGTESFARHINMLQHWTANPTDEVDEAFVSLTAD